MITIAKSKLLLLIDNSNMVLDHASNILHHSLLFLSKVLLSRPPILAAQRDGSHGTNLQSAGCSCNRVVVTLICFMYSEKSGWEGRKSPAGEKVSA